MLRASCFSYKMSATTYVVAFSRGKFYNGMGHQRHDPQGAWARTLEIILGGGLDCDICLGEICPNTASWRIEFIANIRHQLCEFAQEPDRAVQFRNLGRGWVFVLVRRHKRVFKVWFESIRRVEWNHQVNNSLAFVISASPMCLSCCVTDKPHPTCKH